MDKQEFAKLMEKVAGAYADDRMVSERVLKTWYEFLVTYNNELLTDAISEWIKSSERKPTIADIRKMCGTLQEKNRDKYRDRYQ